MKKTNLLSRAEMAKILGGVAAMADVCELLLTYPDGTKENKLSFTDGEGNGEANAKGDCAGYIKNGASRCQYDCGYDGFTASWIPSAD